jgi:hypothetical protein
MSFQPTWVGVFGAGGPSDAVIPLTEGDFAEVRLLVHEDGGFHCQSGPVATVLADAAVGRSRSPMDIPRSR